MNLERPKRWLDVAAGIAAAGLFALIAAVAAWQGDIGAACVLGLIAAAITGGLVFGPSRGGGPPTGRTP